MHKELVVRLLYLAAGIALGALAVVYAPSAMAHPGGMAKDGAHRDSSTGIRHWHLAIPCQAKPCNVGFVDGQVLDHLDPIPEECPVLVGKIAGEWDKGYWDRNEGRIAAWAVDGVRLKCWKMSRAPP